MNISKNNESPYKTEYHHLVEQLLFKEYKYKNTNPTHSGGGI